MTKENLHALCPSYSEELVGPTRARYRAKIEMCDGIDPYELCIGKNATPKVDLLPTVTHADIVNYLVLSKSHVTLQQMKAYESLEGHNYFTSGWVKSVAAKPLASERVIVLSDVNHFQRLREVPLKVWILAKADGTVGTAHCTRMAGVGEACSHVAATLFAVETAVRLRDSTTCTEKKNTWLPAHSWNVEFRRPREIDFSSLMFELFHLFYKLFLEARRPRRAPPGGGSFLTAKSVTICIDTLPVMHGTNPYQAFRPMFFVPFAFNLAHPKDTSLCLEFIQRSGGFVGMVTPADAALSWKPLKGYIVSLVMDYDDTCDEFLRCSALSNDA
ncbi:uncharacterized protein LOC142568347 [Dermacentor variabilis]|uniref:uncharacterized protein LOC142568347 n=1 Tax=Dermacentor variabilis TaxID=34621 RepID=UPI003F5C1116